ncbi:ImcF-related family protein [Xenorhabdus szentirmaii]|uniref:ImcF-related family protein n=1 Tax=Xenorhabdus szentirmaii TaxID=290112 RepID=UPI0019C5C3FF|nr:ImcF-related family protein [Xenorhabdus sp. CUL]MBD2792121.1 type VI secretion protein VasK [Xenorhabdus sp. CUL]
MRNENKSSGKYYGIGLLFIILGLAIIICLLLSFKKYFLIKSGIEIWLVYFLVGGLLIYFLLRKIIGSSLLSWQYRNEQLIYRPFQWIGQKKNYSISQSPIADIAVDIKSQFKTCYGPFWKRKIHILMLMGKAEQVEQLVPGLVSAQWLEGAGILLVWGGNSDEESAGLINQTLRRLRRSRPLDGIIWVTDDFHQHLTLPPEKPRSALSNSAVEAISRQLHTRYQALGWTVPVYVWSLHPAQQHQVQQEHQTQVPAVGCLLPLQCQPETLRTALAGLLPALIAQGTQSIMNDRRQDFLLSLAGWLRVEGIERLTASLTPLLSGYRPLPVAGVMFSQLIVAIPMAGYDHDHTWYKDKRWDDLLAFVRQPSTGTQPVRLGWPWVKIMQGITASLMLAWGVGMLVSFFANRSLITESIEQADLAGDKQQLPAVRQAAQQQVEHMLTALQRQETAGSPLYRRFGLDQSLPLRQALWPVYQHTVLPELRGSMACSLEAALTARLHAPAGQDTPAIYHLLKAYLMMAQPDNMAAPFFRDTLKTLTPHPQPSVGFYADNLPRHPAWKIEPDRALIHQARTALRQEMGSDQTESALYQTLLAQVKNQYADISLHDMTGETEADRLWYAEGSVPGMFTRKAWEETVQPALDRVVNERKNQIDWVLREDNPATQDGASPAQLKARLTARYFTDFAGAWRTFLNGIRWRQATTLAETASQLALMADGRQSPLIPLMNTLAYQGKTGQQALAGSGEDGASANPMAATFASLLALVEPQADATQGTLLSLSGFMTRSTRVRLKLQHITQSGEPHVASRRLAKTIMQGKTPDLSDTRDYGQRVAASLGRELQQLGQALFVAPMAQSWQQLLTPTAQSLNAQWKTAVVDKWQADVGAHYPFRNVAQDASLPVLSQYLRAHGGHIPHFLESHLSGVLQKDGHRWVPNLAQSQGLTFNPQFLRALDTLNMLSDTVFADGEARLHFDLEAGTADGVMQTTLIIDHQKLDYVNQMPFWQAFVWPNDTTDQGATLSWRSVQAGEILYAEMPGPWGWVRLLEQARVEPVNAGPPSGAGARYRLRWQASDGRWLNYTLRTTGKSHPLLLLKLRNFTLPERIFLN